MIRPRIQFLFCVLILGGMLVAGLTPFRRPQNAVTWLKGRSGLLFGRMGMIVSDGSFPEGNECSVEMWLEAAGSQGSSTVLVFSTPENPRQLWVRDYHSSLLLERWIEDAPRRHGIIGIDGVFSRGKPVFVTITSGKESTSIYLNGELARTFPQFRLKNDCTGRLVVGSSTVMTETFSGDFFGLAVYQTELSPKSVKEHFETWTTNGHPGISENDAAAGVYLFDEGAGTVIHSAVRPAPDLMIPSHYSLLHQYFLRPFWKEYQPTRSYWTDLLVNIVGFIPLGFVFCSYWSSIRPNGNPVVVTIMLGFALSLTIEVLQTFLPTRSSGTTDLITNTFGTFLGVRIYASSAGQALLRKVESILPRGWA